MVCRNADRGKQARDEIAEKIGGNLPDACRFLGDQLRTFHHTTASYN